MIPALPPTGMRVATGCAAIVVAALATRIAADHAASAAWLTLAAPTGLAGAELWSLATVATVGAAAWLAANAARAEAVMLAANDPPLRFRSARPRIER